MIKLMQNTLSDYKTFCHDENGKYSYIKWQSIDMLNDVQEVLGSNLPEFHKVKVLLTL